MYELRTSPGDILEYEESRKNYPYLYFCKGCTRSYDSEKENMKCKFCDSIEIKLLQKREDVYRCKSCNNKVKYLKNKICQECGGELIASKSNFNIEDIQVAIPKINFQLPKINLEKINFPKLEEIKNKIKDSLNKEEMPTR